MHLMGWSQLDDQGNEHLVENASHNLLRTTIHHEEGVLSH